MSNRKPVVVVTGASRGIGLAVVKILLETFEANVVAISRTRTPELEVLASDGLLHIQCDVSDEPSLARAISQAEQHFSYIDGLILNAAALEPLCRIGDSTALSAWKTHFDVNFFSLITAIRSALPALRRSDIGGRIVFVSSGSAVKGTAGWGPYNASKAAMNSLCRTLSEEESKVISVALRPGVVDTDMQTMLRTAGGESMSAKDYQKFLNYQAKGELLSPDLPGRVIAALSLQAPASLSGQFVAWNDESCTPFRS
ncbi:NAD(P)-binding protein [Armillaria gallica]|uniref:NAD(P)-binding protein n=1 Tax=Armillaria gallica TaxID=47427 RepID=A0A2H3EUZ2_ARMGA|nr:NAD(P)-binding protein [Armillaria gallica]